MVMALWLQSVTVWTNKPLTQILPPVPPELVHKHPAHLAYPVLMYLEKVQYSRTTLNHVEEIYTRSYSSNEVVRESPGRFNALEIPYL